MPRVLLIENDSSFAADLARVLTSSGYETQVVGEGREGLSTATSWRPQAIVLCVELPDTSGYLVCQRLKKDEALRGIPLVLTSSDATEKSFADHQKLKVRADEYLLKPYVPDTLLEILARVGVPGAPSGDEEELVRFEDAGPAELPALDLGSFGDESPGRAEPSPRDGATSPSARDEDDLFLDGLTGLADERPAVPATTRSDDLPDESLATSGLELDMDAALADRPVGAEDLDAAADSLPDDSRDPSLALGGPGLEDGPRAAPGRSRDAGGEDAFEGLHEADTQPLRPISPPHQVRPASADLLRAAGIKLLDDEDGEAPPAGPAPARPPSPAPRSTRVMAALQIPRPGEQRPAAAAAESASSGQADRLERELAESRAALSDARSEILSHESEIRQLRDKVSALGRRAEQAEAQVRQARTEAGDASELQARLEAAEKRAEGAAGARADAEKRAAEADRRAADLAAQAEADAGAARQVEVLRRELEAARAGEERLRLELEALKAQGAGDRTSPALEKRIAELEAASAKNEDRVLKAYQKIRGDEKVRDKVRKALAIASQLLDEGMAPDPSSERERRAAAVPPRDPKI
jgi:CheY-like chemotaxis protein